MVCLMALANLASVLITNLTSSDLVAGMASDPLQLGLTALNLLLTLLVFLKCVLPGWEPHRSIFGWLLGAWALGSLAGSAYGIGQAFRTLSGSMGFAGIGGMIGGAFGALYGIVISPQGLLLFGVLAKKSTEKIAALVSAVSFGLGLLAIPLLMLAGRFLSSAAEAELPEALQIGDLLSGTLLPSTIAGLVISLCWAVFLFTWPVLDRPVLEK